MMHQEQAIASLGELPSGQPREFEVEGTKVLIVRDGDAVYATGATCPHAGGRLADGVYHSGRIVCPWHKTAFCVRTGAVLDPPALDPLPCHAVRVEQQRVLLTLSPSPALSSPTPADQRCFVIVGAGAAGAVASQTLREEGFGGRIVMLDQENRVPYDRTLLSKYFLSGKHGAEKSPLQAQSFYLQKKIERRTGKVIQVDSHVRRITCENGETYNYDAALLAPGSVPQRPSIPGANLGRAFVLRSRDDAEAILREAERSERVVILGASFIGMEVAASLRERGLDVTVVGKERVPFEKHFGNKVGKALTELHIRHGVSFRLGRNLLALEGAPDVKGVVLEGGERLSTDMVIFGLGVTPATSFVSDLSVHEDGGILVDSHLSAAANLYIAGDIAHFPYRGDGAPVRVEHWRVAEQHGRIAALNMTGKSVRYDAVPVFWTIQYGKRLDFIGSATGWDEVVIHGDTAKPEFLAYYVNRGDVVAAAGFDRDKDMAALVELFSMRRSWSPAALGECPAASLEATTAQSHVTKTG